MAKCILAGIAMLMLGCSGEVDVDSSADGEGGEGGSPGDEAAATTSGAGGAGGFDGSAGAGSASMGGAGGAGGDGGSGGSAGSGSGSGGGGGSGGSGQQCVMCTAGGACGWPDFKGECQGATCVVWCPSSAGCEPHPLSKKTCSTSPCPGKECSP